MKVGVLREVAKFLIEHAQTLAGDFVRLNVVDADLEIFEAGFVQSFDTLGSEVVTIRDQSRDHSPNANVVNDLIEFGVHHRLPAGDCDDRRSQVS